MLTVQKKKKTGSLRYLLLTYSVVTFGGFSTRSHVTIEEKKGGGNKFAPCVVWGTHSQTKGDTSAAWDHTIFSKQFTQTPSKNRPKISVPYRGDCNTHARTHTPVSQVSLSGRCSFLFYFLPLCFFLSFFLLFFLLLLRGVIFFLFFLNRGKKGGGWQ